MLELTPDLVRATGDGSTPTQVSQTTFALRFAPEEVPLADMLSNFRREAPRSITRVSLMSGEPFCFHGVDGIPDEIFDPLLMTVGWVVGEALGRVRPAVLLPVHGSRQQLRFGDWPVLQMLIQQGKVHRGLLQDNRFLAAALRVSMHLALELQIQRQDQVVFTPEVLEPGRALDIGALWPLTLGWFLGAQYPRKEICFCGGAVTEPVVCGKRQFVLL